MTTKYLSLLWILTLLLAPLFFAINEVLNDSTNQVISLLEIYPVTVIFSLFLSIPTLLVIYLIHRLTMTVDVKDIFKKLLVIVAGTVGMIISLDLVGGSMIPALKVSYSIALVFSFLMLELHLKFRLPSSSHL